MLQVKPYSLSYQAMSFMKWPFRAMPAWASKMLAWVSPMMSEETMGSSS